MIKINKKLLIELSSLIIGIGVISPSIISNGINYNSKIKEDLNTKIDYNLVESLLFENSKTFKNIRNESDITKNLNKKIINNNFLKVWNNLSELNNDLESFKNISYDLSIEYKKEIDKSKTEYLNKFKNENYSLENINSFLNDNFSEYEKISSNFNEILGKENFDNLNRNIKSNFRFSLPIQYL